MNRARDMYGRFTTTTKPDAAKGRREAIAAHMDATRADWARRGALEAEIRLAYLLTPELHEVRR